MFPLQARCDPEGGGGGGIGIALLLHGRGTRRGWVVSSRLLTIRLSIIINNVYIHLPSHSWHFCVDTSVHSISFMIWQFVLIHAIRQNEISALLYSWIINTPSAQTMCPQRNYLSFYFRKNEHVEVLACCGSVRFCLSPVKLHIYIYIYIYTHTHTHTKYIPLTKQQFVLTHRLSIINKQIYFFGNSDVSLS